MDEAQAPRLVVGIGASAGGLEALERFFRAMPSDSEMAFVVIQHLSPDHPSIIHELLSRFTGMRVVPVTGEVELSPNHVYVLTPGRELELDGQVLRPFDRAPGKHAEAPITRFFRSLARSRGPSAAAIVLSGTGTDGSSALLDVHDAGGQVLVQSLETARFSGMPGSAIALRVADHVVAPEQMPALLEEWRGPGEAKESKLDEAILAGVFARLKQVHGVDFSFYKHSTVRRRIDRRLALGRDGDLATYAVRLGTDDAELDQLYRDLLIGVTQFFRDPEVFERLRDKHLPELISGLPDGAELRVWVPACATGEEAYSIGIQVLETFAAMGRPPAAKIFATDLHRGSLQVASDGVFEADSLAELPESLRTRYFEPRPGGRAAVIPELRKLVLFSPHNLLRDTPFNRLDLVSCRNLLIYFQPAAQLRALAALHFALKRSGVLVLGPSETLGEADSAFTIVDRDWKIFRKRGDVRMPLDVRVNQSTPVLQQRTAGDQSLARIHEQLLRRFVPSGALVNDRRETVHLFGNAQRYLKLPTGPLSSDILSLCDGHLRAAIASGLSNAQKRHERVLHREVPVDGGGSIDVVVEPFTDKLQGAEWQLVLFESERPRHESATRELDLGAGASARIQELEDDLQASRLSLQKVVEELESTNEELQASNEELIASNEELQSTNEELHSVNEELYAVNAEHEQRIRDQSETVADLRNLLAATEIGTVFTDRDLRIRLFSPKAAEVLNLMPLDVGRPLHHITSRLIGDDTIAVAQQVLQTHTPHVQELRMPDGRTLLRQVRPYVDAFKQIGGVILLFIDISSLAEMQGQVRHEREQLRNLIDSIPQLMSIINSDGTYAYLNESMRAYTGVSLPLSVGGRLLDLVHPDDRLKGRDLWTEGRQGTTEFRLRGRDGTYRWFESTLIPARDPAGVLTQWFSISNDIDARKIAIEDLRIAVESLPGMLAFFDRDLKLRFANEGYLRLVRRPFSELRGKHVSEVLGPERYAEVRGHVASVMRGERVRFVFLSLDPDGSERWFQISYNPVIRDGAQEGYLTTLFDITEEHRAERKLAESEERFRKIADEAPNMVWLSNAKGEREYFNRTWLGITGRAVDTLLGDGWMTCVHPEDAPEYIDAYRKAHAEKRGFQSEYRLRKADGTYALVIVQASPRFDAKNTFIGLIGSVTDVSLQRESIKEAHLIEKRLLEAARLESLGVLAGGIAHDFNNILTGILANASMARGEVTGDFLPGVLDDIQASAERAADLCKQMLAYAGRGKFDVRPFDLSALVRDTARLVQASIPKTATLRLHLPSEPALVVGDASQLRQVVMNLVINGGEAVGEGPGALDVSVDEVVLRSASVDMAFVAKDFQPGRFARLTVSDTGHGIPHDQLTRIFEPFFTTKFTGRGLGLSAVQGILGAHKGALEVESSSKGTTFRAYLPTTDRSAKPSQPPSTLEASSGGVVLVVDDEDVVRSVAVRALVRGGYSCDIASNGLEAVALVENAPSRYRLVLLDLTMPEMDGRTALARIRVLAPELPVVIMSGYSSEETRKLMEQHRRVSLLQKPFDSRGLLSTVNVQLGHRPV
ncbi:MAG: PAS domain-containing protein [Deltaproteobacteria bacterium]|nr:PAS domain-containing protein [Deltaproteobacteria bacterium]